MQTFKSFSNLHKQIDIQEDTLWGGAIKRKPEAYVEPFLAMWKDKDKTFKREDIIGTVDIEYNKKQADALQAGADLGIKGEDLTKHLRDSGVWEFDTRGKPLMKIKNSKEKINFNKLSKENVNPQKSPSGAQWESLISIGFNLHAEGVSTEAAKSLTYKESLGVDKKTFNKVTDIISR